MIITNNTNSLEIDGVLYAKDQHNVVQTNSGIRLVQKYMGTTRDIPYEGVTADGVEIESAQELFDYFRQHGFKDGGGNGSDSGLQVASIDDMVDGTNNTEYVTPYLVHAFVEWFSAELLIIDETYTESPTSAEVNEKYPNARLRTILYLPNAGSGMKYTKLNQTQWESMPYTVA